MQTFILMTLIALGVAAPNWRQFDYSQRPIPLLQTYRYGVSNMLRPIRNAYYQNGFSQWNPQHYPQENLNDYVSYANAEWICRAPQTGDMLIIASETKDQRKESSHHSEQDHGTWNQRNTNSHTILKVEDETKENDMKNHGGEGLIDVRIGI